MLLFHSRSLAVWAIAAICICGPLRAQDPFSGDFGTDTDPDPGSIFGGAPAFGGAAQPTAATAGTSAAPAESDPLVLTVRENPPKSPKDMARAIVWMAGIKRMDEVSRLLDMTRQAGWALGQKAELGRDIGLARLLRIKGESEDLSDENKKLLSEIIAAPKKVAEDPSWINKWLHQLASNDVGSQRLAYLRLQDSGSAAIGALATDLLSDSPKVKPHISVRCIRSFGDEGISALRAACENTGNDSAAGVISAVAEMDASLFAGEIAAALHGDETSSQQRAALQEVDLPSTLVDRSSAIEILRSNFSRSVDAFQVARGHLGDLGTETRWELSENGKTIEPRQLSPVERALSRAAHSAALLLSVETDPGNRLECTAILLQSNPNRTISETETNISGLLQACERLQLHAAALNVLKGISSGKIGSPLKHLDLVSKYLSDSRPQFRFEALAAVAQAEPHFSFAGAEKSLHVAFEMSQLRGGPSVLAIGHHSDLTQAAKQQVESILGGHAYTANTAREAIGLLSMDAPIEHILIVDRLPDQSLFVFLQRLRGGKATHDLPIAVLTDDISDSELRLIGRLPGVIHSVLSRNDLQIRRIANTLNEQLDTPPMNDADRVRYFEIGSSFLTEVISDRAKYAFYPVGDLRERFQSLGVTLSSTARTELLKGLGTSDSQLRLIAMASDGNLNDQDRINAAKQFATSAKRFGLLLDRQSQLRIYDLYNQQGPSDPTAAEALGIVLDAVEQQ